MFKKLISMATATLLFATGLSVVAAPSANAYASTVGSSSSQTGIQITPDSNGDFEVPAGLRSLDILLRYQIATASSFQSSNVTLDAVLRNNENAVVTSSVATAAGLNYNFYHSYSTNVSQYTFPSVGATMPASLSSLFLYFNFSLFANSRTGLVPTGIYNFTGNIKKDGVTYTPSGDEKIISVFAPVDGQQFTVPALSKGTLFLTHRAFTCVDRSLVTASDTLTLRPVTTGSLTTNQTGYVEVGMNGSSTSISSSTTLSLSSVDLTKPLVGAVTFTVGSTTAASSFSSDLSITKGDGTEVSGPCYPTPAAPTVSFVTTTRLTATFTVINGSLQGSCQLFRESDMSTVVTTTFGSSPNPPSGTTYTCNFSNLTQGVAYRVKVSQSGFFSNSTLNVNGILSSAFSSASLAITSGAPSSPTLTAEQIAAAAAEAARVASVAAEAARIAAIAAAAARVAAIVTAKVKLQGLLKEGKPGTLAEYQGADLFPANEKTLARVNAEVLKLAVADRENADKIKVIVKTENFIEQVSTTSTQKSVTSGQLVEQKLIPATSKNKATSTIAVKNAPTSSLTSLASVQAVIDAHLASLKARQDRTAAIKAKIAARNK